MRLTAFVFLIFGVGCGADRGTSPRDASVDSGRGSTDGSVADRSVDGNVGDGGSEIDGSADAGAVEFFCRAFDHPNVIVTTGDHLRGGDSVTVRLAIRLEGPAATGIEVRSLDLSFGDAAPRSFAVSDLQYPPDFSGSLVREAGQNPPELVATLVDDAQAEELAQCDLAPWDRALGRVRATVFANETGEVEVECPLGSSFGGRGPEELRFGCATGIPGAVDRPNMSYTEEFNISLIDAQVLAMGSGPTTASAFAATRIEAYTTEDTFVGEAACAEPTEWSVDTGRHDLWRGGSSDDTWSGPVQPGSEEVVNWFWQENRPLPAGFCFPPGDGSIDDCLRPSIYFRLHGQSSVGAWSWESDIFDCLQL
ncbi:MAG: hypothetical protein AAGF12_41975 [Myxococcota bacterium]